jgi:hypothetical protein
MKLDDIEKILERNLRIEAIAKDLGLVKKKWFTRRWR